MDIIDDRSVGSFGESEESSQQAEEAFVIINGIDLFPLRLAITSIGRKIDNELVLNDPRVSRRHAELRCFRGRYVVFDMGSSGGTYVNGHRVTHSIVYDGDVISLAGVQLIFRQKNIPRPDLNKTTMF